MAHRLIVQVIFTGAQVFGRAFTEAYRQAAQQTAKQSASSAGKAARDFGITLDESSKILDIDMKNVTIDKIDEKYNHLFDVNSKEKGNSFYLQSKIYWAAERLKSEIKEKEAAKAAAESEPTKPEGKEEAKP